MIPRRSALLLLTAAVAAAVPYVAEQRARAHVHSSLRRCRGEVCGELEGLDLDVRGLSFHGLRREAAGRIWRARRVVVAPRWSGLEVDVFGLQQRPVPRPESSPRPEPPEPPSASDPGGQRAEPLRVPNRGIPIALRIHDPLVLSAGGVEASVDALGIDVDAAGAVTAHAMVEAEARGHVLRSSEPITVWPRSRSPRTIEFEGAFELDASGAAVPAHGVLTESTGRIVAGWSDARAEISFELQRDGARPQLRRASVSAENFPISPVWTVLVSSRPLERLGLAPQLRVDGDVELVVADDVRLHLAGVELTGLSLDHRKLARSRLDFDPVTIEGDAWFRDANSFDAQLLVGHRDLTAQVAGSRRGDAVQANLEIAPLPCQQLLDSVPDALTEVVRGTRADGTFEARLALSISLSELARIRGLDASQIDPLDPPRPGTLEVELPFLEHCTITDDAPGVDLSALDGAYRHRFIDGRGRTRERAMAPGAPGFVELRHARQIADAFIVLEDTRFYDHDGFDREQMRNAWWHNLVVGRISRGASTITQQTARNLFLGVDRSLGRKLQEAFFTARLESRLSKSRILELYINVIELAPGVHGVDDAARFYFGTSARQLTPLQAIHLASLAPAPHTYAERFVSGEVDEAWMDNLRDQARRMYWHHRLSREDLQRALRGKLGLVDRRPG